MSNFLNSFYTNLNDLVSINATDINTQKITANEVNAVQVYSTNLNLTGAIYNGSNQIVFDETTEFTEFNQNVHIYGTLFLDYNNVTLNVGQLLISGGGGGGGSSYPSITYDPSTNTTTFIGNLSFSANQIASSAINNSDFLTLETTQTVNGVKTFSGTQIFSSIQLNSNLIVNSGGTTITNAQLQLIPNISTNTTNISTNTTDINNLKVKTTNISYNPTGTLTTIGGNCTFTNAPTLSGANISEGTIPIAKVQGVAVNLNGNQVITGVKQHTGNLQLDASLLVGTSGGTVILNSTLVKINNISDTTSAVGANLTSLQNQINSINTDLDDYALQSAVQAILDDKIGTMFYYQPTDFTIVNNFLTNGELQYTPDGTQKINLIPIITSSQNKLLKVSRNEEYDFFDISSNCHIYGKLQLGNYADVAYSLNAVIIAEGVTAGATGLNTASLITLNITTIPAMNLKIDGTALTVADHSTDIGVLQQKTQKISYSVQDNFTTIAGKTSIFKLYVGDLESGLIQTENLNVRFIGVTEIRNDFIVANGFGASIDGGINQLYANGLNTFSGALTVNNDFTSGGTNTNIDSTNCKIAGLTTIKLNTQNPILSVVLPSTVGAFNAQGILIGKEQTNGQARNCNIGYNYAGDGSQDNYGYLGLNVLAGAGNLKECFRWFPTGCAIPTGNLTISTGDLTITAGSVSVPTGNITLTAGNVNLTNGNVSLTNGDVSILNGDAFLTTGNLSLTSGNCNLTNGDINLVSGELKTNTIANQSGSALDINANNINIGTNQGVLGLNTVYIGNILSGTIIYLNGAVSSPYGFNVTGAFTQWT